MEWIKKTAVITIVIVIIAGIVVLISTEPSPSVLEITNVYATEEQFRIGIFGAVQQPGYYNYQDDIRIEDAVQLAGGFTEEADTISANLAKWVNDGETIIIPTRAAMMPTITPPVPEEWKIGLNTATLEDLKKLPGIGDKRAADIIRLRELKGRFEQKEDLLEINGISERLLESIYDRIIVD